MAIRMLFPSLHCAVLGTDLQIDMWFSRCCRIHWVWGLGVWRVLAKCHELRNLGEYEGDLNVDERLLADLIAAGKAVAAALEKLPPPS